MHGPIPSTLSAILAIVGIAGCVPTRAEPPDASPAIPDGNLSSPPDGGAADAAPAALPGETCATAIPVAGATWNVSFTIHDASADHPTVCDQGPLPDRAFVWTAPASGRVYLAAQSPIGDFDPSATVYPTATCAGPSWIICGLNTEFEAVGGATYHIVFHATDPDPSPLGHRLSAMLVTP